LEWRKFPTPGEAKTTDDHFVIGGAALGFDDLLNEEFFAPKAVDALGRAFRNNAPFPHIVFENLFNPRLLELMHSDFDRLKWSDWRRYDNANERKHSTLPKTRFGRAAQVYFNTVHSSHFIDFLERVTGIEGLIPDPALHAGGFHEIPEGGRFRTHLDFNRHPVTRLDNRLVFITYLNKDWRPSYGGALELWSMDEDTCLVKVEPTFGRTVMFRQSARSMHGHPSPVHAPDGRARRSAAAYFYSNGRSDNEEVGVHSTIYGRPIANTRREKVANALKYLTPPVVVDMVRALKKCGVQL
jgi:Rps23 Pro-64 3,4-dihydroxylase Tpa1-like proline 4-hydroxylase